MSPWMKYILEHIGISDEGVFFDRSVVERTIERWSVMRVVVFDGLDVDKWFRRVCVMSSTHG